MELVRKGEGSFHSPPAPNAPLVEVLHGGYDGGPDVGMVRVEIPAGSGMREHDHGGSDVVLVPVVGSVEITKGDDTISVDTGDAALIRKEESVSLRNPGTTTAQVLVAAAPPRFVGGIRQWPAPE